MLFGNTTNACSKVGKLYTVCGSKEGDSYRFLKRDLSGSSVLLSLNLLRLVSLLQLDHCWRRHLRSLVQSTLAVDSRAGQLGDTPGEHRVAGFVGSHS